MSTGNTRNDLTQKAISLSDYIMMTNKEINELVKEGYSFPAFLMICSGIEFLGKCVSGRDWFKSGYSKMDFNTALSIFPSLNKYADDENDVNAYHDIYHTLRCGIVHALVPNNGITLTDKHNNRPKEVGLKDLANDYTTACNDLVNGKVKIHSSKSLSQTVCFIGIENNE